MAGPVVEEAIVRLVADTKTFLASVEQATGKATGNLDKIEKKGSSLGSTFAKIGVAIGGMMAGFAAFQQLKSAISDTQELGLSVRKLARETGLSAEDASRLVFAFKHVGLEASDASRSIGIFAKKLKGVSDEETGVTTGGKSVGEILKDIGVKATDADGNLRPITDLLPELAEAFQGMPDSLEKTGLAMQLFGRSGKDMIPLLNMGEEGIKALGLESDKLGTTLSGNALASIMQFTYAQRDFKEAILGIKMELGMALIPQLTRFLTWFNDAQPKIRQTAGDLINLGQAAAADVKPFIELGRDAAKGIQVLTKGLSDGAKAAAVLGTVLMIRLLPGLAAGVAGFLSFATAEGVAAAAAVTLQGALGPLMLIGAIIGVVVGLGLLGRASEESAEDQKQAAAAADEYTQSIIDQAEALAKQRGEDTTVAGLQEAIAQYTMAKVAAADYKTQRDEAMAAGPSRAGIAEAERWAKQIKTSDESYRSAQESAASFMRQLTGMAPEFALVTRLISEHKISLDLASQAWPGYIQYLNEGKGAQDEVAQSAADMAADFQGVVDDLTDLSTKVSEYDKQLERLAGQETQEEVILEAVSAGLNEHITAREAAIKAGQEMTQGQLAELAGWKAEKDAADGAATNLTAQKKAALALAEAQMSGLPTMESVIASIVTQGAAAADNTAEMVVATGAQVAFSSAVGSSTGPLAGAAVEVETLTGKVRGLIGMILATIGLAEEAPEPNLGAGYPSMEVYKEWQVEKTIAERIAQVKAAMGEWDAGGGAAAATASASEGAAAISSEAQALLDLVKAANLSGLSWEEYSFILDVIAKGMKVFNLTSEQMIAMLQKSGLVVTEFARRLWALEVLEVVKTRAKDAADAVNGLYDAFNRLFAQPTREEAALNLRLTKLKEQREQALQGGKGNVKGYVTELDKSIATIEDELELRRLHNDVLKAEIDVADQARITDQNQQQMARNLIDAMGETSQKAADMAWNLWVSTAALQAWTTDLGRWMAAVGAAPGYQSGGLVPGSAGQATLAWLHGGEVVLNAAQAGALSRGNLSVPITINADSASFADVKAAAHAAVEEALTYARGRWYRSGASLSASIG